jgi:SAM-dependent methyltransferase
MYYSKQFGIVATDVGWVPAPRYILRRAAICEFMVKLPTGRVLEIGCGAGALLYDLSQYGFYGVGVEQSVHAFNIASQLLTNVHSIEIVDKLTKQYEHSFEYLLSFEVLEHIKDDEETLREWAGYLKPEGILLISVPAHHRKWSKTDVWAGHHRRYERVEIIDKLENAGFKVASLHCYGWPLSNLIEPIRSWVHGRQMKREALGALNNESEILKKTSRSGIERSIETRLYPLYANWAGKVVFSFFINLQRFFYSTDLGTGYLVVAKKRRY